MSEFLRVRGGQAAAAFAATLALAGCAEGIPLSSHNAVPLGQCFDAPLPPAAPELPKNDDPQYTEKEAAWSKAYNQGKHQTDTPISLHYNDATGWIDQDQHAQPNNKIVAELKEANVLVKHDNIHGSGFVTNGKDGEQVIVTAAHVVANNDVKTLRVTNSEGQTVHITKGCYIYENHGQRDKLDNDVLYTPGMDEYDIAILRPDTPLSSEPLTVAKKLPARGTWLTFVNDQLGYTPDHPAVYSGLEVTTTPNIHGNTVLTGLEPWQKSSGGEPSYTARKGDSGGLVANSKTGDVVGTSIGGDSTYTDNESAASMYNVHFNVPVGNENGIVPTKTTIIGADAIRTAITSSRY